MDNMESMKEKTIEAKNILMSGTGKGNDYIGWIDLPINIDQEELSIIKKAADKIRSLSLIHIFCRMRDSGILAFSGSKITIIDRNFLIE